MHELLPRVIFYIVAGVALLSAVMVITQNNPVRCVLFLVLAFFSSAVLWMLVSAEFLALILVLVYVGAVMTLFLFVVMMLNCETDKTKHFLRYVPFGLFLGALLTGLLMRAIPQGLFLSAATSSLNGISNTEALGLLLYSDYVFAFELAAVILLVAIIAAITLVHRAPSHSKRQQVVQQMMTRRQDRVTLVQMKSEK